METPLNWFKTFCVVNLICSKLALNLLNGFQQLLSEIELMELELQLTTTRMLAIHPDASYLAGHDNLYLVVKVT